MAISAPAPAPAPALRGSTAQSRAARIGRLRARRVRRRRAHDPPLVASRLFHTSARAHCAVLVPLVRTRSAHSPLIIIALPLLFTLQLLGIFFLSHTSSLTHPAGL